MRARWPAWAGWTPVDRTCTWPLCRPRWPGGGRGGVVAGRASPRACVGGVDAGGQNVHVAALSAALARRGHQVVVYTRREDPGVPARGPLLPGGRGGHLGGGPATG